jgi:RNA polymerase sigma factor (sigma-70 family)
MNGPDASRAPGDHPLQDEPERLEAIVDLMWAQIHKVLRRAAPRRKREGTGLDRLIGRPVLDQLLAGDVSPEDILSEALIAVLSTEADKVSESWEAFAVGVARNKTKQAIRDGQAGLRATEHRPALAVISGDASLSAAGDEGSGTVFDTISDPADLEHEVLVTNQQLELVRLAHELLDDRDRTIFLGLHFEERTRQSLAEEFGLTGPGVTHIYRKISKRLHNHPRFLRFTEGGES